LLQNYAWQNNNSFTLHFYSIRSICLQSLFEIPLIVLELCPWQSSKCKHYKGNNSKNRKSRVTFFCIALLSNEIYLPTKFPDNTCCRFGAKPRAIFKVWKKNKDKLLQNLAKWGHYVMLEHAWTWNERSKCFFFYFGFDFGFALHFYSIRSIFHWYILYILSYVPDKKYASDRPTDYQLTPVYLLIHRLSRV
jgi:hypothetical protein